MRRLSFFPALAILALVALTGATTPSASATALFGPPWISIEYPGNPFDRDNRDAFLYVHAFHHANAIDAGVVGRAEGIVDGRRRSVELQFTKTARPGRNNTSRTGAVASIRSRATSWSSCSGTYGRLTCVICISSPGADGRPSRPGQRFTTSS